MFSFPLHSHMHAVSSTGVVVKNNLLDRAGSHLAVLSQMYRSLRRAIGLPCGIQAIHVGFAFFRPDLRVLNGRQDEAKNRNQQEHQRNDGRVADAANLPLPAPALQTPNQRSAQESEPGYNDNRKEKQALSENSWTRLIDGLSEN